MIPFLLLFFNNFVFLFLKLSSLGALLRIQKNFFMQSLPLYTSYLFSLSLNYDIGDILKPGGICLSTSVVDDFSGLFLYPSIFSIKD